MQLQLVLGCLAVYCLLSPLGSFAQSTIEAAPGPKEEITLGNPPPAVGESQLKPLTAYSFLEPSSTELTSAASPAPDPSADPQVNGNNNAAPVAGGVTTGYVFPSSGKVADYWVRNTFGPRGFIGPVLRASWNTWVDTSP